jgi:hypothetical protein
MCRKKHITPFLPLPQKSSGGVAIVESQTWSANSYLGPPSPSSSTISENSRQVISSLRMHVKSHPSDCPSNPLGKRVSNVHSVARDITTNQELSENDDNAHPLLFYTPIPRHECKLCDKTFRRAHDLQHHVKSAHLGVSHFCDVCRKSFRYKCSLLVHVKSSHRVVALACGECAKCYVYESSLREHIKSVHRGESNACDQCQKKYRHINNLRRHVKSAHTGVSHS